MMVKQTSDARKFPQIGCQPDLTLSLYFLTLPFLLYYSSGYTKFNVHCQKNRWTLPSPGWDLPVYNFKVSVMTDLSSLCCDYCKFRHWYIMLVKVGDFHAFNGIVSLKAHSRNLHLCTMFCSWVKAPSVWLLDLTITYPLSLIQHRRFMVHGTSLKDAAFEPSCPSIMLVNFNIPSRVGSLQTSSNGGIVAVFFLVFIHH